MGLANLTDASEPTSSAVLLALGTAGLMLFVGFEARAANPLMPLSLFGNRVFSSVNAMTFFLYGSMSVVFFLLPFDLIERRGLTATQVGLTLAPFGIVIGALSSVAGDWSDRHGPRAPLIEIADVRKADIRINRPTEPSATRVDTIHIINWKSETHELSRADVPLWLMRFSTLSIASQLGIAPVNLRLTVDDVERYGPGILVDYGSPGAFRMLMWVE